MSLSKDDIQDIRGVFLDAFDTVVNPRFDRMEATLDEHTKILNEHTKTLDEHTKILNEHTRILHEHDRRLTTIEQKIDGLDGRLRAIEADIKELYEMSGEKPVIMFDKKFAKLPQEEQVRSLYKALVSLAEQMHIEL